MRCSKTASGREAPPEKTVAQTVGAVLKSTVSDTKGRGDPDGFRKTGRGAVFSPQIQRPPRGTGEADPDPGGRPQRILVIQSPEALELADGCVDAHFHPPVLLVVSYDPAAAWVREKDGKNHGEIDAAIAATQMMLQAADLGLGTTYIGMFDPVKIQETFPEELSGLTPIAVLALGYPAEGARPSRLHADRKPLETLVRYR